MHKTGYSILIEKGKGERYESFTERQGAFRASPRKWRGPVYRPFGAEARKLYGLLRLLGKDAGQVRDTRRCGQIILKVKDSIFMYVIFNMLSKYSSVSPIQEICFLRSFVG